jgi:hypothetical protein
VVFISKINAMLTLALKPNKIPKVAIPADNGRNVGKIGLKCIKYFSFTLR